MEILAVIRCLKIKQSVATARQGIRVEIATPLQGSQGNQSLAFTRHLSAISEGNPEVDLPYLPPTNSPGLSAIAGASAVAQPWNIPMIELTLKVRITVAELIKIAQVLVMLWFSVSPLT